LGPTSLRVTSTVAQICRAVGQPRRSPKLSRLTCKQPHAQMALFIARLAPRPCMAPISRRTLFNFARKTQPTPPTRARRPDDDEPELFHLHSQSPSPAIRLRGERIKKLAQCPVCLQTEATRRNVKHECQDCGWPTHCTHEHWEMDEEHAKYCTRLREVNEDDHDLRSGRMVHEFAMPGILTLHIPFYR
jgi:Zinc-finger of mitochondrial splicing suppressor 51